MPHRPHHPPKDATGARLRVGDVVRIVGVPDLSTMQPGPRRETLRVCEYLLGRYKRIQAFGELGLVELDFRIPGEPKGSSHTLWLEPHLVRKRRSRRSGL